MLIESSVAPLHSLSKDNQNEVQHHFLLMCYPWQWHQCHVMQMVFSMAPLHSLHHNACNEVQYDFFGDVIPLVLVLASYDADGIINGTIAWLCCIP